MKNSKSWKADIFIIILISILFAYTEQLKIKTNNKIKQMKNESNIDLRKSF